MAEVEKMLKEMEEWEKKKETASEEEIRAYNAMKFARMFMPSGNATQEDMQEKIEKLENKKKTIRNIHKKKR